MTEQTSIIPLAVPQTIINLVLDAMQSQHSKRAYQKALEDFLAWYNEQGKPGLSKATVQRYRAVLEASGLSTSSVNLKLSAIRKLASEASDNGLLDQPVANGISKVRGVKTSGVRLGHWLSKEQATELINAPDVTTLKGLRDRAILACLIGSGLRRQEMTNLTVEQIQKLENRWLFLDITGKGNKIRSVPIPGWVKTAIDQWIEQAGITTNNVFCSLTKWGTVRKSGKLTPQAIMLIVNSYSSKIGHPIAPHDLRRTFAKLSYKGGSGLDQIQLSLGHASLKTTEKYLGVSQSLTDAPCDHLDLQI
jgi:site-specific recombinase XerD